MCIGYMFRVSENLPENRWCEDAYRVSAVAYSASNVLDYTRYVLYFVTKQ